MAHTCADWRMKAWRLALALTATALPLAYLDGPAAHAQSIMRSPNLNIESRIPSISPTVAPRIDANIAGRAITAIGRTSPNLRTYSACSDAYRDSDGQCRDKPVTSTSSDGGGSGSLGKGKGSGPRRNVVQTALNLRTIAGEIVAEIDGSLSDAQADALARRHGLARLQSQNF